jgi:GPH family glycoside/pentoside/hexuronide:cation symporter
MLIYIGVRSAIIVYYFDYFVGKEKLATAYLTSGTAIILAAMFLPKWLTQKFGKRNSLIGCLVVTGLAILANFWARPQDIVLIFTLQLIQSFASGPTMPLLWSMMADAADYSEWKTGRRATALFYSASTFGLKSGGAIGGALALWILAGYGYEANIAQSAHTLFGMRMMMSVYPAIGVAVCIAVVAFYALSESQLKQIETDLIERRKGNE